VEEQRPRLLVVKAAMTVHGGAARDLLRNLPSIAEHFEVRFACLNLLDSQRTMLLSMTSRSSSRTTSGNPMTAC